MDHTKDLRWRQRFENFEKAYLVLKESAEKPITTELERAGLIQLFEMTFELSWKVLKDYLEAEGYTVKGPRESIKQAFQMGLIEDGHVWMDALSDRNLTTHTYDEVLADKLIKVIKEKYDPAMGKMYQILLKER